MKAGLIGAILVVGLLASAAQAQLEDHQKQVIKRWDLTEAQILDTRMRKALIRNSVLSEARLELTNLDDAVFERCEARGLSLLNMTLRDPSLSRVEFVGGKLEDVSWRDVRATRLDLTDCRFERGEAQDLHLRDYTIRGLRLDSLEIRDAVCENTVISYGRFSRGSLRGARFDGVDFSDVELRDCDIRGMKIDGVSVEELLRHR